MVLRRTQPLGIRSPWVIAKAGPSRLKRQARKFLSAPPKPAMILALQSIVHRISHAMPTNPARSFAEILRLNEIRQENENPARLVVTEFLNELYKFYVDFALQPGAIDELTARSAPATRAACERHAWSVLGALDTAYDAMLVRNAGRGGCRNPTPKRLQTVFEPELANIILELWPAVHVYAKVRTIQSLLGPSLPEALELDSRLWQQSLGATLTDGDVWKKVNEKQWLTIEAVRRDGKGPDRTYVPTLKTENLLHYIQTLVSRGERRAKREERPLEIKPVTYANIKRRLIAADIDPTPERIRTEFLRGTRRQKHQPESGSMVRLTTYARKNGYHRTTLERALRRAERELGRQAPREQFGSRTFTLLDPFWCKEVLRRVTTNAWLVAYAYRERRDPGPLIDALQVLRQRRNARAAEVSEEQSRSVPTYGPLDEDLLDEIEGLAEKN